MDTLYRLSVMIHIVATSVWVGGMLFFALVSLPVYRRLDDGALRQTLVGATGRRFRVVGWAAVAVLGVTGVINAVGRWGWTALTQPGFWASQPGRLMTLKLLLVAAMVALSALHDFYLGPRVARADPTEGQPGRMRERRLTLALARTEVLLGLAIIGLAVLVVRGLP